MTAKILQFDTEEQWLAARKEDVTATDSAALLGLSKWKSRFALWHEKKSGIIANEFVENERTTWGKRLQNVIAHGICEDNGWTGEDLGLFYIRDESTRLAASLDVKVICPDRGEGLMEVKNVGLDAFSASWTDDTAPVYYESQLQQELHLANKAGLDIKWGVIAALVGGNKPVLYFRDYDPAIGAMLEREAETFWSSIANGEEPKPDYSVDGALLGKLRGAVQEKNTVDLSSNNRLHELVAIYKEGGALEKQGKEMKDTAKEEILQIVGTADKALFNGGSITAGMVAGGEVSYTREPYRMFKVNMKKAA